MKRLSSKHYAHFLWRVWSKAPAPDRSALLQAFLVMVQAQRALKLMPQIIHQVQILEDKAAGLTRVRTEVADSAAATGLEKKLSDVLGSVVVDVTVNPRLIAGLKVQISDELIDGSVATRLQRLQQHLSAATK